MNYDYTDLAHAFLWAIFLFGTISMTIYLYVFEDSIDKKLLKLTKLQRKVFEAQRKGDIRLAGELSLQAEKLEKKILKQRGDK